jgi:hypothetical protein
MQKIEVSIFHLEKQEIVSSLSINKSLFRTRSIAYTIALASFIKI